MFFVWRGAHTYAGYILAIFAAVVFSFIPFAYAYFVTGGAWSGVVPDFASDSYYYYARAVSIAHGDFFSGDPYLRLGASVLPITFTVGDHIYAVPLLLSVPFEVAVLIQMMVWIAVLLSGLISLFRLGGLGLWASGSAGIFVFLSVYLGMVRPVSMQFVYPACVFLSISAYHFLERSTFEKRVLQKDLLYGFFIGLTIYIYSFLFQTIGSLIVVVFVWGLIKRDKNMFIRACMVGITALGVALPYFLYTALFLMSDPAYGDTLERIGFVKTHVPSMYALLYGRWVLLGLVITWILRSYIQPKVIRLTSVTGAALLFSLAVPILAGIDFENGVHVGRFIALWMAVVCLVVCAGFKKYVLSRQSMVVGVASGFLILLFFFGVVRNIERSLSPLFNRENILSYQRTEGVISWLQSHTHHDYVVAPELVSAVVPALTNSSVVYGRYAVLFLRPNSQIAERYALSRAVYPDVSINLLKDPAPYLSAYREYLLEDMHLKKKLCSLVLVRACEESHELVYDEEQLVLTREYGMSLEEHPVQILRAQGITTIITEKGELLAAEVAVLPVVYSDVYYEIRSLREEL